MTTLVGIETKYGVAMAADSQITEDNLITISSSTPKIISRGKYLIGFVGDTRPADILAYTWSPPVIRGSDPVEHMGRKVIPSIIKAFNEGGYNWNVEGKAGDFEYLIAFGGNLFHIACDMSFLQSDTQLYALGTGGQFALGYMWANHKNIKNREMTMAIAKSFVNGAVVCASVLDINTGLPVQLVTQERG